MYSFSNCCFKCMILIIFLTQFIVNVNPTKSFSIVMVIITQPSSYHNKLTQDLIQDINNQINKHNLNIQILFEQINEFEEPSSWTFFPIFKRISSDYDWILFAEPRTRVNIKNLQTLLKKYNANEKIWIGHAIYDHEPSIIHHFAFHDHSEHFKYPNAASGFLVSRELSKHIVSRSNMEISRFSIDAAYELALFIWKSDNTLVFTHDDGFCTIETEICTTYVLPFEHCANYDVLAKSVLFAVKTCKQYHQERVVNVIKHTWAKYVNNILYFSEEFDVEIPTIKLLLNDSKIERGFCGKTKAILKYLYKYIKTNQQIEWIALVDDDTIISVSHLVQFLSCFDQNEPFVIGQRYGFDIINGGGFNYVTGGGGIVFNKHILETLSVADACECPTEQTPDDMYIFGECLARWQWPIVHSSGFHQARPEDYAPEYLLNDHIISFHKHWMVDPVQLYQIWFQTDDSKLFYQPNQTFTSTIKDEF